MPKQDRKSGPEWEAYQSLKKIAPYVPDVFRRHKQETYWQTELAKRQTELQGPQYTAFLLLRKADETDVDFSTEEDYVTEAQQLEQARVRNHEAWVFMSTRDAACAIYDHTKDYLKLRYSWRCQEAVDQYEADGAGMEAAAAALQAADTAFQKAKQDRLRRFKHRLPSVLHVSQYPFNVKAILRS